MKMNTYTRKTKDVELSLANGICPLEDCTAPASIKHDHERQASQNWWNPLNKKDYRFTVCHDGHTVNLV